MPRSIFISYRREDSVGHSGRIADRLSAHFGKAAVFIDVDAIPPGEDFVDVLTSKVSACDTLIAVIGRSWLLATDEHGRRRLDDPDDFVVVEIRAALERKIRVIPVLVGGAVMPRPLELPDSIRSLARRNALQVSDTSFHSSADKLIEALELPRPAEPVREERRDVPERLPTAALDRIEAPKSDSPSPSLEPSIFSAMGPDDSLPVDAPDRQRRRLIVRASVVGTSMLGLWLLLSSLGGGGNDATQPAEVQPPPAVTPSNTPGPTAQASPMPQRESPSVTKPAAGPPRRDAAARMESGGVLSLPSFDRSSDSTSKGTVSAPAVSAVEPIKTPASPKTFLASTRADNQKTATEAIEALQAGRNDEAIDKLTIVVAAVPTCSDCYYNLGVAYARQRRWAEAEAAYKKAIELKPAYPDAYSGLASIYNDQRRFSDALAATQKANALSSPTAGSTSATSLYNEGVIFFNQGKFADARTKFEAATRADANLAPAFYQLGMTLINLGQQADAGTALEAFLKLAPGDSKAAEVRAALPTLRKAPLK